MPNFRIADLVIECPDISFSELTVLDAFRFEGTPDVILRLANEPFSNPHPERRVFSAAPIWDLWRLNASWLLRIPSDYSRSSSIRVMGIFDEDYCHGDLHFEFDYSDDRCSPGNTTAFVMRWLVINLLNLQRGVLLHSCGLNDNGRGVLFVGVSGAGKTTTAHLWKDQPGVTLLSDDRVIVRKREEDDRLWIYGTPWHGDAKAASPESVPLEKIFVLNHAPENRATRLSPSVATRQLLPCASPAFWSREGVEFTLEFLDAMVTQVPTYSYGFVPDMSSVEYVKRL